MCRTYDLFMFLRFSLALPASLAIALPFVFGVTQPPCANFWPLLFSAGCTWLIAALACSGLWPVDARRGALVGAVAGRAGALGAGAGARLWARERAVPPGQPAARGHARLATADVVARVVFFCAQAQFAELTTTPVTPENARHMHALAPALPLLHFSPEPRVIEKLIASAQLLGLHDEVALHSDRYRRAYAPDFARWQRGGHANGAPLVQ